MSKIILMSKIIFMYKYYALFFDKLYNNSIVDTEVILS